MPDTYDAKNSDLLMGRLKDVLAHAQARLHALPASASAARRATILARAEQQIDQLLDLTLGKPPERFVHRGVEYTPQTYAKEVLKFEPKAYVLLTNAPSSVTAPNRVYRWNGELGFRGARVLNVSSEIMAAATRATLDRGDAVWFTTQMGEENPHAISDNERVPPQARNALHIGAFDYRSILGGVPFAGRRARLEAETGWSNHAMSFVGYDFDEGAPDRVTKYEVHNPWGSREHLYADFFHAYVDMIAVPVASLPPALRRTYARKDGVERFPLPIPR
jgi:bleomycin hydrolase